MSKMTGTTLTAPLAQIETPLLAVALAQGGALPPPSLAELDRAAGGVVARAITSGDFKGKRDETALLYPSGAKPQRLLLVGLGKTGDVTRAAVRRAAAVAAKRARALGATQFTFALAAEARNGLAAADVGQVVVEGSAQGAWAFTELKAAPEEPKAEVEAVAVACDAKEAKAVGAGERLGEAIAAGHFLTRYLQMLPGNVCTPAYLADRAKQLADEHGFTCSVLDRAQMRQENMGALLAGAQGSQQEPRFIVLEYRGAGAADPPVALVGKGVTFDSGGISIKPAQNMEDMKFDMSGAAAVLGTFAALGRLKPRLNVVGVIPATENLPSGTAGKLGDVVKSYLGKTIEIINTDGAGGVILCDALSYVKRFKPAAVIDIATLTGAVVVALGQVAIGMMGNDEAPLAEVREAGERAGERGWLVPARIRGGVPLGPPRHRRNGLHRGRGAAPGQGSHGGRCAAVHRVHPQARGGVTRGLGCAAVLLSLATAAAAQVDTTARRDTTVRDSTARDSTARRDSTRADTVPRYLPVFPAPLPAGPAPRGTRYSFTAASFALANIRSLSERLAHIPGVDVARGGIYGAAEPVLYGGRGPAGLELYWDGVRYLPLGRDSLYLDPARIALAPLEIGSAAP